MRSVEASWCRLWVGDEEGEERWMEAGVRLQKPTADASFLPLQPPRMPRAITDVSCLNEQHEN